MKRLIVIICAVAAALSLCASAKGNTMDMNTKKYGLHVENDGTITLDGKPFYGCKSYPKCRGIVNVE